jgi:hypothetical protein
VTKPKPKLTDKQRQNKINNKGAKNVHSAKNNYPKNR